MVGPGLPGVPQQVRIDPVLRRRPTGAGTLVDGPQPHDAHKPLHPLPAHAPALPRQPALHRLDPRKGVSRYCRFRAYIVINGLKLSQQPCRRFGIDPPQFCSRIPSTSCWPVNLSVRIVRRGSPFQRSPGCCHDPSGRLPGYSTHGRPGVPVKTARPQLDWRHRGPPKRPPRFRNMGMGCCAINLGSYSLSLLDGLFAGSLGRKATTTASKPASTRTIQKNESTFQDSMDNPQ